MRAPERVEVAGHDDGLLRLDDQIVERAQLVLAVAELQRQVHQEHADVLELELDDEPLDPGIEVVEALPVHVRRGEKGIALLAHDGHQMIDRARAVLALERRVVPEFSGDRFRLVHHAGADRAGVDLDEADDVRVLRAQEIRDACQDLAIAAQVPGPRHRQVKCRARTRGVADVIDDQTQRKAILRSASKNGRLYCISAAPAWAGPRRRGAEARRTERASRRPALVPNWALCPRPIPSGSSSRTPGSRTTTTCGSSSTRRARGISSTAP